MKWKLDYGKGNKTILPEEDISDSPEYYIKCIYCGDLDSYYYGQSEWIVTNIKDIKWACVRCYEENS